MEIKVTVVKLIYVFVHFTSVGLMADRNDVKFNRMLKGQTLTTFVGISLDQCWNSCEQRVDCMSINYQRRIPVCELNYLADSANLIDQTGFLYLEKIERMEEVKCGVTTCYSGEVCDIESNKCKRTECKPIEGTFRMYVMGNKMATGSKARIGCKRGFIPSNGNDLSVTSVCRHGNWSKMIECIPLTCMRLAEAGVTVSNMYESYDEGSQKNIDIFCEFNDGSSTGHTFLSPETLKHLTNISNHYTCQDHVMLRYLSGGGQFESKMKVLPELRNLYNISVSVNEDGAANYPLHCFEKPYLFMQFVPTTLDNPAEQYFGYSCNGHHFSFYNYHGHLNYFALFETTILTHFTYCQSFGEIGYGWMLCSEKVHKRRNLPDVVFFDWYQMQMGWDWDGCFVRNCEEYDVTGMAFGLPFDY